MKTVINFQNDTNIEDSLELMDKFNRREITHQQYFDRMDGAMYSSSFDELIYIFKSVIVAIPFIIKNLISRLRL